MNSRPSKSKSRSSSCDYLPKIDCTKNDLISKRIRSSKSIVSVNKNNLSTTTTAKSIPPKNDFKIAHERNDLPVLLDHSGQKLTLKWRLLFDELDFDRWLPLFASGLSLDAHPLEFLAFNGFVDLLNAGRFSSRNSILDSLPFCIPSFRLALRSGRPKTAYKILIIMQIIAKDVFRGGRALVPYYRQLLPPLEKYRNTKFAGEGRSGQFIYMNDVIRETLDILEANGGPDAYINIKYLVPLYEKV
uniref:Uncharacterized protein n=1 Tax=Romanomermis culicivorax TaxID=13658 RepID=A0A915K0L6_ROMCU